MQAYEVFEKNNIVCKVNMICTYSKKPKQVVSAFFLV